MELRPTGVAPSRKTTAPTVPTLNHEEMDLADCIHMAVSEGQFDNLVVELVADQVEDVDFKKNQVPRMHGPAMPIYQSGPKMNAAFSSAIEPREDGELRRRPSG